MITLKEANKELAKTVNYIKENEKYWNDVYNMKLYDISSYCWNELENDFPLCHKNSINEGMDLFQWFCEDEYMFFEEWLQEENINKNILKYIGRTSSFTIGNFADNNINYGIDNMLNEMYYFNYTEFTDNFEVLPYGEFTINDETVQKELEYIVNNLLKDVKEALKDIIKVANYIDAFKSNSLEDFKSFLEMRECELQDQKEEREKHNEKIRKTIEKSNLTSEEKDFLKKNLEVK